jgi:trehalose/maltose hydrolase-like predicted phosphorylase
MEVLRHILRYRTNFQLVPVRRNANRRGLLGRMSNLESFEKYHLSAPTGVLKIRVSVARFAD